LPVNCLKTAPIRQISATKLCGTPAVGRDGRGILKRPFQ
jgi:hypothetical protein